MLPDDLPDKIHIEFIRTALWRPRSRAAVMIGAGFSRNAEKISGAVPDFPLWWDVASRLYEQLYPGRALGFGVDVLRLGQEYVETYGQTALDDLIAEIIPDGKYEPGSLHEMLLKLPWSDVFTMNYDTLIERTRAKVHEIKYDVVLTASDIARAERPRIVKLHGSFPSQRPFIFTTEDYRRYPSEQAPFVNMVRQSIMENAFCLIGFSGDDPNFLQWAGWVRDELGPTAPRMYLCGVLDLTASRRRYFESTQIIPVDIGPLFPESLFGSERYERGTQWLLESLAKGKPLDRSKWPEFPSPKSTVSGDALAPPPLPARFKHAPSVARVRPDGKPADVAKIRELVKSWRGERESYPGWTVIPELNRAALWIETHTWLYNRLDSEAFASAMDAAEESDRLELAYEVAWRARRCLTPLPSFCVARIRDKLTLPPIFSGSVAAATRPSGGWDHHTSRWVELAFAMVNDAWQEQDEAQHELWMKRLQTVVKLKPEWQARWSFARCWQALMLLDEAGAHAALKEWPANEGLPFWEAKRATVLAELGDLDAAISIVEAALERVRQGIDASQVDYRSLSEEGWLVDLLRMLIQERRRSARLDESVTSGGVDDHVNRLRELHRHRCDPGDDGERRAHKLHETTPGFVQRKTFGFDPGSMTQGTQIRTWEADEWVLLQTFHDGVWPLRCGWSTIWGEGLADCVRRLWPACPRLAVAIAIRAGQVKVLEEVLDRASMTTIDSSVAEALFDWLSCIFREALKARTEPDVASSHGRLSYRVLVGCPAVLSRLSVRLPPARLEGAFDLATMMYKHNAFTRDIGRHEDVEKMFRRVIFAASPDTLLTWFSRLLSLPIVGRDGFEVEKADWWPEPMEHMRWEPRPLPPQEVPSEQADIVARLVRVVQEGEPDTRRRASVRLATLSWSRTLTDAQAKSYVGALWSKTDATGFPDTPGFAPWFLLKLPGRRQDDAREAVVRFFMKADIESTPRYMEWLSDTAKTWKVDEEERVTRVEWSSAEVEQLLQKVMAWRRKVLVAKKASAKGQPGPMTRNVMRRRSRHLVRVVADIFIRSLALDGSDASRDQLREFVSELDRDEVSILCAEPTMLLLDPSRREETAKRIRAAIHGRTEDEVIDGGEAFLSWLLLARDGKLEAPPPYLMNDLVSAILMRRQPGLSVALQYAKVIVWRLPDSLEAHHLDGLASALQYLRVETANAREPVDRADELPLGREERVDLRHRAADLAAHLAKYYLARDLPVPPQIEAWHTIGMTDPLPEVRWVWAEVSLPSKA